MKTTENNNQIEISKNSQSNVYSDRSAYIGYLHSQIIVMLELVKDMILINASTEDRKRETRQPNVELEPLRHPIIKHMKVAIEKGKVQEALIWNELLTKIS